MVANGWHADVALHVANALEYQIQTKIAVILDQSLRLTTRPNRTHILNHIRENAPTPSETSRGSTLVWGATSPSLPPVRLDGLGSTWLERLATLAKSQIDDYTYRPLPTKITDRRILVDVDGPIHAAIALSTIHPSARSGPWTPPSSSQYGLYRSGVRT